MIRGGIISLTKQGLFCERGGFYIDPWQPVDRAVITHSHSDHAYRGSKRYLVAAEGERLARIRLDPDARIVTQPYGKFTTINGVKLSFHPAGHILGSSQVRVEYKGEVWVISGDYKLTPDATCAPFEPVKCNFFITEATFGLPIYRWPPTSQVFEEINDWWRRNQERGKASVLFAYALGKSQRILNGIDSSIGPIYTHGAVERLNQAYREAGVDLPPTIYAGDVTNKKDFVGSLIVAPPSAQASTWLRRFGQSFDRVCVGLDDGPRRAAAASDRSRIRAVRSRRLAGTGDSDSRDGCGNGLRHTRICSEELVRWLNENGCRREGIEDAFRRRDDRRNRDDESKRARQ